MKLEKHEHKGINFYARKGTSDKKTFDEVIVNNVYETKHFKILPKEHWIDLGGNVGAFTLQAISKGATADVYEPDPFNCKMIEKNLKANNFNANIHQKAVVSTKEKFMTMYVGNDMQTWRNSLYKNWGNQKFKVPCIHFEDVIKDDSNLKMDIEGAEMTILEQMKNYPNKMVAEWSLDIDGNLNRYRRIVDKLKPIYNKFDYKKQFYDFPDDIIPNYVFPKADNFICYEKN